MFFVVHAKHNLIKLKLYNNWSVQVVNNISECAMWNHSHKKWKELSVSYDYGEIQANQSNSSPLNISQSINVEQSTCDRNKSKKFLGCSM